MLVLDVLHITLVLQALPILHQFLVLLTELEILFFVLEGLVHMVLLLLVFKGEDLVDTDVFDEVGVGCKAHEAMAEVAD